MTTLTINPPALTRRQHRVWEHPARFQALAKGRRWGGTQLMVTRLFYLACKGNVCWFVSPAFTSSSHRRAWRYLVHYASQVPGFRVNKVEHSITSPNGGVVVFKSAEQPDSMRGDGPDFIGVDEGAFIVGLREMWDHILRPALADRKGSAWFTSSPNGFDDFHGLWVMGQDAEYPDWKSWRFPSWTNPFLDPMEIDAAKAECSELTFRQEWGAEFVAREGRVFHEFARDRQVKEYLPLDKNREIHIGMDFGFRSFAAVVCQRDKNDSLLICREAFYQNRTTEQSLRALRAELNGNRIAIIGCDPAGDSVNLHSGVTDVSLVRSIFPEASVVFSTAPNHRDPEWRAARIRDLLFTAKAQVRCYVARQCSRTIAMLEQSVYPTTKPGAAEKNVPVKDGVHDHLRDGLGYLVVCLYHLSRARNEAY